MTGVIIQPNCITNARYDFSALQKNIMTHIVGYLQDKMTKNNKILFGEEIITIQLSTLDQNNNYLRILKEGKEMMDKKIEYEVRSSNGKETEVITSMLSSILHEKGSKEVQFIIPSKAVPVFCYIGDGFTKYRQIISLTLQSIYSKRIYEQCCKWEDKGGFKMKLSKFREMMGIPATYKNSNIKQRCLDPAKAELKEGDADLYFEANLFKSNGSRSFNMISFKIIKKKTHKLQSKEEQKELNKDMYSFVYRFLDYFYPYSGFSMKVAGDINLSGNLEAVYERFVRLEDEYTNGTKGKEDIVRLVKHILKSDFNYWI